MIRPNWETYALILAKTAAIRSEDPYTKVGAVALRHDHSIAGLGYNGLVPGMTIDWSDRDDRLPRIIHAEKNALRYCKPGEVWLLAVSITPCEGCLTTIASYGIKRVIYEAPYNRGDEHEKSVELAKDFGISLEQIKVNWTQYTDFISGERRDYEEVA